MKKIVLLFSMIFLGVSGIQPVFAQNFANYPTNNNSDAYQIKRSDKRYYFQDDVNFRSQANGQNGQIVIMPAQESDPEAENFSAMQRFKFEEFDTGNYTLGPNDIIEVFVDRHPEVSGSYLVNWSGNIQYEFVGDLYVQGKTKDEVKDLIVDRLGEYIISPEVLVKISGFNSKVIYVLGEVKNPGKYIMRGDTMTVREALVQANLLLPTAKASKSVLITPAENGQPVERPVDVRKLLFKGDLRENLVMKAGDTLFVPPTGMTKVMRAISPVAAPISTASGAAGSVGF